VVRESTRAVIFGNRTIWPSSHNTLHWEIRKACTIPGYQTDRLETPPVPEDSRLEALDSLYRTSCLELLETRIDFYALSMPASTYRRTSLDFHMERVDDPRIDAYVDRKAPDTIVLHDGTVLAVEDAAHSLFATWPQPFDLPFPEADPLPLRLLAGSGRRTFVEYRLDQPAESWCGESIPLAVANGFLIVSTDVSRQIFADHVSTMALLWVIAHEDAHKYCGHLAHFERTAISPTDRLFDELIAGLGDPQIDAQRRAAELEADTAATMRAVDYCFDNEFLAITTDWVSPDVQVAIRCCSDKDFSAEQRLFMLRLIAGTSVLPLLIFEQASRTNAAASARCYPSFAERAMNVIFTTASRAVDVSLHQPQNRVGEFSFGELGRFFALALHDAARLHLAFRVLTGGPREFMSALSNAAAPLFDAFLGYHGQAHILHPTGTISLDDFGDNADLVGGLLRQRHAMDIAIAETFSGARARANMARAEKVREDIALARGRIETARETFSFLR
jgi:hypothetical protein